MQDLSQNGYTADEVKAEVFAETPRWEFRYDLLDKNNNYLRPLEHVISASVSYNALAEISGTAQLSLNDGDVINFLSDRVRPWARLNMPKSPPTLINPLPGPTTLASWSFNDSTLNPTTVDSNVSASAIGDAGGAVVWLTDTHGYLSHPLIGVQAGTGSTDATSALATANYLELTVTPDVYMNLTNFRIRAARGGSSEPRGFVVTSSADGHTTPLASEDVPNERPNLTYYNIDLSSIGEVTAPITIRVYAYAPVSTNLIDIDDIEVIGAAYAVKPSLVEDNRVGYVEWPQGVYLLSSPVKQSQERGSFTRDVDCYDQTLVLSQDLVVDRYTVLAGDKYTDKVIELIDDLIDGTPPNNVTPSPAVLPTTREWEPGTSKLQIINDLLSSINYQALFFDRTGLPVAQPYQSPSELPSSFTYEPGPNSILRVSASHELDLFDVFNQWVLVVSEPDRDPLVSVYTNNNPASPTSTVSRGRTITERRESEDVVDQATLDERASRIAFEASQVYEAVEFQTGMAPFHGHADVITINHPSIQVSGRYVSHKYDYDLRSGAMVGHRVRRIVNI